MTALRPYQTACIAEVNRAIRERHHRKILLQAPCAAGKGHIAAELVRSSDAKGKRVLFVVHRRELVLDMADRVRRHGIDCGVILPGEAPRSDLPVQIASVQTLARRELPPADRVIADECHHSVSESWRKVLDAYPGAIIVGFTATPARMSGAPLGDMFDELIPVISPAELLELGHTVPMQGWAFASPALARLRSIPRTNGDFDQALLGELMSGSRVTGDVIGEYRRRADGSKAIVFACNVDHSQKLTRGFLECGIRAEHLDGTATRTTRDAAFARFRSGETQVLCQVNLFTEGVDLPDIETIIMARPTASLSLYLQSLGRGGRPVQCSCGFWPHWRNERCACGLPNRKRFIRLHDHAGVTAIHGLRDQPRVWSLSEGQHVTAKQIARGIGSVHACRRCLAIFAADLPACPLCAAPNAAQVRLVRNAFGVAVPLEQAARLSVPPHVYLRGLQQKAERMKFKSASTRANWFRIMFRVRFHRMPTAADWAQGATP